MESLRSELTTSQTSQEEEEKKYAKIRVQMKVKERIKQDLGGLTDTVVSSHRGCVLDPGTGSSSSYAHIDIMFAKSGKGSSSSCARVDIMFVKIW